MTPPALRFQPSLSYSEALDRAAEAWGIGLSFWDAFGNLQHATPEIKRAILASIGVASDSLEVLNQALEQRLWEQWSRPLPPTIVIPQDLPEIAISVLEPLRNSHARFEVTWEDSTTSVRVVPLANLPVSGQAELRDQVFYRLTVQLRAPGGGRIPLGYHHLRLSSASHDSVESCESHLIVCPSRALLPEELSGRNRMAGIAVNLYGLRSNRNWGCGDFTDLERFTDWVAHNVRVDFVALNPLHAIPNRAPYNTSPYLPNCSFYRNFLYLDVERVEDLANTPLGLAMLRSPKFQSEIEELRRSDFVEYERVSRIKLRFLKAAFRAFLRKEFARATPRALAFQSYLDEQGALLRSFAVYCALEEILHKRDPDLWIWPQWPAEFQNPESEATQAFAAEHPRLVLFYQYLQWLVDQQLAAAQEHARSSGLAVGLYHDLALATDRCGSDLWAHRAYYATGCRVGAPPDVFSPKGQDWGFPPPNSVHHLLNGYQLFRTSIRNNCRHGGALRIDHVMRFFRLYWIPDSMDASSGAYVRDNASDLLHILALESARNRVLVVGEDLGTVEPEVRGQLAEFGILSYRLLYFEKEWNGEFRLPHEYPAQSLVASTTHDLATLAGFWIHRDIEARWRAGLLPDEQSYLEQRRRRDEEKQKLLDVLFRLKLMPDQLPRSASDYPELTGELHNAVIGFLASTPCSLMVLNEEDLTKELDQQNLPGSTSEYPNWRRKMVYSIEDLFSKTEVQDFTLMFRNWLARSGRLHR
jgi:4-alpha-glucanotransferase